MRLGRKTNTSSSSIYHRHRFPPDVIAHAVWQYFRFPLSLLLVEDLLAERGIIDVDLAHVKEGWRITSDAWDEHQREKAY